MPLMILMLLLALLGAWSECKSISVMTHLIIFHKYKGIFYMPLRDGTDRANQRKYSANFVTYEIMIFSKIYDDTNTTSFNFIFHTW